jgi:hypothetical protein
MRIRTFLTSLICIATLSFGAAAAIRPEVGQPLNEALKLAAAHNYKAALARVDVADAAKNKSEEEISLIFQVRKYLTFMTTGPTQPCKGQECDF